MVSRTSPSSWSSSSAKPARPRDSRLDMAGGMARAVRSASAPMPLQSPKSSTLQPCRYHITLQRLSGQAPVTTHPFAATRCTCDPVDTLHPLWAGAPEDGWFVCPGVRERSVLVRLCLCPYASAGPAGWRLACGPQVRSWSCPCGDMHLGPALQTLQTRVHVNIPIAAMTPLALATIRGWTAVQPRTACSNHQAQHLSWHRPCMQASCLHAPQLAGHGLQDGALQPGATIQTSTHQL